MNSEKKKTILLVEDEAIIAMMEKMELEKYGYIVHDVTTGEKAVEAIIANALPVDLILIDINLGSGIDGTQAAEQILNHKDIPVVFLSSHTEPEVVEKTEKITSYGYVVKNSGIVVLDASIKMAFKLFDAKGQIKKSDNLFRLINNASYDQIYSYDLENRFTSVNKQLCDNLKRTEAEVIGKTYWEFGFPESLCHYWDELHQKVYETGSITTISSTPMPDGTVQYFEINLAVLHNESGEVIGITGVNRNITERKQAEEELFNAKEKAEENEKRLKLIGDNSIDSIWIMDNNLKFTYLSKSTENLFGYITEEWKNLDWGVFVHPDYLQLVLNSFNELVNGIKNNISHLEILVFNKNRYEMWVEFSASGIYDDNNRFIGAIGITRDITDRKRTEEEIQKQLAEKELLLREVHHRVKNNIQNIESFLKLQDNATANPEAKEAIKAAVSRVQSMRVLYDNLLVSKDIREITIKNYIEDLIDSIQDVFVDTENIIIEKHISDFSIKSKEAITIGIIINELLTNVFKYAFKDRDKGTISVSIEKTENMATIIIQDNGIGIDERIMENKSPGFGLTIVKMLVEQLGGTYRIVNENGTNSIIQFEI